MFQLEDPVIVIQSGEQRIGEVVGLRTTPWGTLYDVSLEDVVCKALFEEDLCVASAEAMQALLGWYAIDPESQAAPPLQRDFLRRQLLRAEHAAYVQRALAKLSVRPDDAMLRGLARFDIGQPVAVRDRDVCHLGVVCGQSLRDGSVWYDVDVLGERRSMAESLLASIAEIGAPAGTLALGSRARFVVAGHERDSDYEGTICTVDVSSPEARYALLFDDGDILEDLAAADLCVLG